MMEGAELVVTTDAQQQYYLVVKLVTCRTLTGPGIVTCRRQPSHCLHLIVFISEQSDMIVLAAAIVVTSALDIPAEATLLSIYSLRTHHIKVNSPKLYHYLHDPPILHAFGERRVTNEYRVNISVLNLSTNGALHL